MIKARHHILLYPFFRWYVLKKMKRHFANCEIIGEVPESGKPMLCVANHMSWWDGIWVFYVNEKKFQRRFHFMMLEEQLKKNWFFKYTGGFSVKKSSKSVIS